ncbi:hypothetical protein J6590_037068 [Homalodisca vitripennis]|nr:hypothetical protein J6590_037068 [Homalodisca vitripennis]
MERNKKRKLVCTDSEIDRELSNSDCESDSSSLFSSDGQSEYVPSSNSSDDNSVVGQNELFYIEANEIVNNSNIFTDEIEQSQNSLADDSNVQIVTNEVHNAYGTLMDTDKGHSFEVVKKLMKDHIGKGHTLFLDNFYNSIELAEYLMNNKTNMSGTLRSTRAGNPEVEQETNSFHANQKEIIGKYEDQLKKTKDENETLKKEVARLANTFYKSTPTPKKDLEKQNERLRREIEDLSRQLDESKATCQKLQEVVEHTKGRPTTVKLLLPNEDVTRFSSQAESTCSEPPDIKVMSTSKIRPRRTRATAAPVIQVSDFDQEAKLSEIPQKQTRKQLWDTNTQDTTLEFEDVKIDMSVPHDSPGTVVKRCLRKRNK